MENDLHFCHAAQQNFQRIRLTLDSSPAKNTNNLPECRNAGLKHHCSKMILFNIISPFTPSTYLVSRFIIISLTSLILFILSFTLFISVLLPRALLAGVIFLTLIIFIPCGLFRKLSISSSAFSAPSDDWNLSMGCKARRSTPVLHHLLT